MITLKADANVLNHNDIMMTFDASSSSIRFPVLDGKIEGRSTISQTNGIIMTTACPSTGLIGVQLQTKYPQQVRGRIYGRYPSAPSDDVEILAMKMSVVDQEKVNIQTTWNMEIPYDVMLSLKTVVPKTIPDMKMVCDSMHEYLDEVNRVAYVVLNQGKVVFKRVSENIMAMELSKIPAKVSDSTMVILRQYQKSISVMIDAAIKFLRQTKFQMPGFQGKMTGLELYYTVSTSVAQAVQEKFVEITDLFSLMLADALAFVRNLEVNVPGSTRVVRGSEILDDLAIAMKRIRGKIVTIVKKVGAIQLDDILSRVQILINVSVEKVEQLFNTLDTQNLERVYGWAADVYADAMNSDVVADIAKQVVEIQKIIMEYFNIIKTRCQEIVGGISKEQLQADVQSGIDVTVKRLNVFHNNAIVTLKDITRPYEQYVQVSSRQVDIDIPLPMFA